LILQYQSESPSHIQIVYPTSRQHPTNENRPDSQPLRKFDLDQELVSIHVAKSVLHLNSVCYPIAFEDEVQVMLAFDPHFALIFASVSACHDKLCASKSFKHHRLTVQSKCCTNIWIRIFLDQSDKLRSTSFVKPIPLVPDQLNARSRAELTPFTSNQSLVFKIADRTVSDPMKILILILNLQLAREEDALPIPVKELTQMISCLKFPLIGRRKRIIVWLIQVGQLVFSLFLDLSPLLRGCHPTVHPVAFVRDA